MIILIILHLITFLSLTIFRYIWIYNKGIVIIQLILLCCVGISACAGAHRLFVHNSYEAHITLQIFYLIFICMGGSGSTIGWIKSHRTHHKYAETDLDPHDSRKGFWYSHFGWTITDLSKEIKYERNRQNLNTLKPYLSIHKWIDKHYKFFVIFTNSTIPILLWTIFVNSKSVPFMALLITSIIRLTIGINMAACVNSLAHKFGTRPYNKSIYAYNNIFVSILTWGEGWHNYHHTYSKDFRASGHNNALLYWNPSHIFIICMAKLGLAYNLKIKASKITKNNINIDGNNYEIIYKK